MSKLKTIIDDGFNAELVETAFFDGVLEIPRIERPTEIIVPDRIIPFTQRNKSKDFSECLAFYEHDTYFAGILKEPSAYVEDVKRFGKMLTLDCSLYRDITLTAQIANTYRNRAIGHFFQKQGIYVIPNVRWGDERSYTTSVLPEKFAFLGVPKQSIVSIGTYGAIQGKENKFYFKQGLAAMLDELEPMVVLVYGSMPDSIFSEYENRTQFIHYPDWTTLKRKGVY
jgi:hypothetical protein